MKNKSTLLLTLGSLIILNFSSCIRDNFCIDGNGNTKERIETLSDFNEVVLHSSIDVVISQGPQEVRVVGDGNIIDDVKLNVSSDELSIDLRNGCYNNIRVTVHITMPELTQLRSTGSGDITVQDFDDQNKLRVKTTGSGDVELNEYDGLQDLELEITGSGNIEFNDVIVGIQDLDIHSSGSGDIDAFNAETEKATIKLTGSGNSSVRVFDDMDVTLTGSGDVKYKGNPSITQNISGSGRLINRN